MEDIIVPNKEKLEKKKQIFKEQGNDKIHILSDFDRTITNAFVNGKKINSLMSHMRKNHGEYLTKDYAEKSKELAKKYHPIEYDPNLSIEMKKREMKNWWGKHSQLLIDSGLKKSDFERISKESDIKIRENFEKFITLANEKQIPFIIFSSSGVGESIPMIMKNKNLNKENIRYIINRYKFDEKENAINTIEPIIHVFNKDETAIQSYPKIFEGIKNRKNIILIGDSLGDLGMSKGFEHNEIIRIGFLNDNIEENMEKYKENFDIIITNDGSFEEINKLLEEIS